MTQSCLKLYSSFPIHTMVTTYFPPPPPPASFLSICSLPGQSKATPVLCLPAIPNIPISSSSPRSRHSWCTVTNEQQTAMFLQTRTQIIHEYTIPDSC